MQLRSILVAVATVAVTLAHLAGPAAACEPVTFDTPYDLHDQAATVALVKVARIRGGKADLTVVEAFKGNPGATLSVIADTSTCSPGLEKGATGVVYLDAGGHMLGLYDGFQRDAVVIDALRAYGAGPTVADRAAVLLDLAVGRDWTRAYQAGFALANRVELVIALDASARDRIVRRLAKVGHQQTLILVAARLHDPRVPALQKRRRFDSGVSLKQVLAGAFEVETDPVRLADTIAAAGTSTADRIAAMERCERLRNLTLTRFTDYIVDDSTATAAWTARGDACRTGTPIP